MAPRRMCHQQRDGPLWDLLLQSPCEKGSTEGYTPNWGKELCFIDSLQQDVLLLLLFGIFFFQMKKGRGWEEQGPKPWPFSTCHTEAASQPGAWPMLSAP